MNRDGIQNKLKIRKNCMITRYLLFGSEPSLPDCAVFCVFKEVL